jgi:hypothetical protein
MGQAESPNNSSESTASHSRTNSTSVRAPRPAPPIEASDDDWAPTALDDARPLVPPGEYMALCYRTKVVYHRAFKRRLILADFQIADGEFQGTHLQRFYTAVELVERGSSYYKEWTVANGGVAPRRRDRMAPRKLAGKVFKVEVRTVEKGWDGRALPEALRYSKVAALTELVTTNEAIVN